MRGSSVLSILALLALPSCGDEPSEEELRAKNAAAAEEVRATNDSPPPLRDIVPEAIESGEIEANDLAGEACAYAPGTSGATRLIAREADAVIKLDGELMRFAADPGSRALQANTRTLYNGMEYVLRLDMNEVAATDDEANGALEGTMWLYDRWDRVVYTGTGAVTCGD